VRVQPTDQVQLLPEDHLHQPDPLEEGESFQRVTRHSIRRVEIRDDHMHIEPSINNTFQALTEPDAIRENGSKGGDWGFSPKWIESSAGM